jgi:hypothetical protein
VKFARASGILLHPTSLPSRFGIGDFGPAAYSFVDFLQESAQKTLAGASPQSHWICRFTLSMFLRQRGKSSPDQPGETC